MKNIYLTIILTSFVFVAHSQANKVLVKRDADGIKLVVDDKNFMVNGMNWDYIPIGTNYEYSLWNQPDNVIKEALKAEMTLLKNMGVNAVRIYTGIPQKWIQHIYENYGIYTMLNHSFGRYGVSVDGDWMANTEYSDPRVNELLLKETRQLVKDFKDTPGLLLFLLGNENNFGLFWGGAETEDIPVKDKKSTIRARAMYKLFNEAALAMKEVDDSHPIALCNGDLQFLNIIKEECKDVDIFGTNMYRGISFGDAFQRVKDELDKPILFTEFGADAFNAIKMEEDQDAQAYFMLGNWKEIYANAAGLGKAENTIGGFTFQFSDGWWKIGQTKNLDVHDNDATWEGGGYKKDHVEGKNNMNEEWFGICSKGESNEKGLYTLTPREAYYKLTKAHKFNPYASGASEKKLQKYFSKISK